MLFTGFKKASNASRILSFSSSAVSFLLCPGIVPEGTVPIVPQFVSSLYSKNSLVLVTGTVDA